MADRRVSMIIKSSSFADLMIMDYRILPHSSDEDEAPQHSYAKIGEDDGFRANFTHS
jgi:hypothetical protein